MSEPIPVEETAAADAGAPPEQRAPEPNPPAHFGAILRAAREAAAITVPALAGRLRLHVRQIEAIERADLGALPSLIYVRGFVRSCARELKIDAEPLLADLNRRAGVGTGAPPSPAGSAFPLARFGDGSRPIIGIVLVVLVVAGVVGTLIPRRNSITSERAPAAGSVPGGDGPAAPAAAPVLPDPSPAEPAAAAPEVQAPAAPPAASAAPQPAAGAAPVAPGVASTTAPGSPKPGATKPDAHAQRPAVPGGTVAGALPAVVADATAVPAAAAPAPAPTPSAAEAPDLVLHVRAASWVEVVQSNGTPLLAQICAAGSVQEIKGKAPLRIVIGNAAAVDAQYRGNPVDLTRYANVNGVARFTLE